MKKILVVEDDGDIRSNILDLLSAEEYDALGAADGNAGVAESRRWRPDLVVCDIRMPGMDGYAVLAALRADPSTTAIPFIFLTAKADRTDIRKGMEQGADDYVTKPFSRNELLGSVRARLARAERLADVFEPAPSSELAPASAGVGAVEEQDVVVDPAMTRLYEQAALAAAQPISVLVLGETGVGKEILAQAIHRMSPRAKKPILALNCAALSESLLESELFGHEKGSFTGASQERVGLLESAAGGTVFLDEVGDLPLSIQIKLLRVLEDRQVRRVGGRTTRTVDVRFVAATNRDLGRDIEKGTFRQDLYYRLEAFTLTIPPLRERVVEIGPLARLFIRRACGEGGRPRLPVLSDEALAILEAYPWPGNVRELRNVISHTMVLCTGSRLLPDHLPPRMRGPAARAPVEPAVRAEAGSAPAPCQPKLSEEFEAIKRQRIIEALQRCQGNQTQAARLLGISRRTMVTLVDEYDLPRPRKKSAVETEGE